jgi:nitric oxide reductase NorD protein
VDFSTPNTLANRLADALGTATATALVARLVDTQGRADIVVAASALLDELTDESPKAAEAAIEALPELDRRAGLSCIIPWLDVAVALASSSGATALRYFKDSPLILGLIEPADARAAVLAVALELAEEDANVTLEYLRTAPRILAEVPFEQLRPWLAIGVELVQVDVVVGLEYIRHIPALAPILPLEEVRGWLSFGLKLIRPNSLGKPDYMGTMEFLRTSPVILGDLHESVRSRVIALGSLLADHSPESGIAGLSEAPRLMQALPSIEWQVKVLQYGSLVAEKDAEAALNYLRRSPDILSLIGEGPQAGARFETWFKAGMDVLAYSAEGARAYFAVASQKALASVETAMSGVPLRRVARTVKLFVEGLCGAEVSIAALPDATNQPARAAVSADGKTISLPAVLRRYPAAEDNERLYLIMAAHEAGHLEFGTYRLTLRPLRDLIETVRHRYGRGGDMMPDSLAAFFRLYPRPSLVRDLWVVLEDARIEFLLQHAYPGLRNDLAKLAAEAITPRDPAHGLTVRELLVDCLLRLSTGEPASSAVPRAVMREAAALWELCQTAMTPGATAEDTVRLVDDVYARMEELLAPKAEMLRGERATDESPDPGAGPTASETNEPYRPVTNWMYRGAMNPEFIAHDDKQADDRHTAPEATASHGGGSKEGADTASPCGQRGERDATAEDVRGGGRSLPAIVDELLQLEVEQESAHERLYGERAVRYPEWDYTIQDYRLNWCRVVEREADAGSDEPVSLALNTHRSAVRTLRRYFEGLRPPAFRRMAGQIDGEELDIDAVVRRAAEHRAGQEGGDRLYVRREKKERDVAVAFLVDVSGSTGRQLTDGRRAIEIERESLVLLCEALDAVGDQYALYAYSGEGRGRVDFLTIKEFDERRSSATAGRLGGLVPRQQNRDGAAIRHACAKLLGREAKTRMLVLLSDGRPLDGDYKDDYSLEDTKVALREARRGGIEPFCVTVDREADAYLRRMYGDVQYTVIDRIEALPVRLPRVYQRLTA